MSRLAFVASLVSFLAAGADAVAQESAKVQITIKISDKTPSFTDQRLVVSLSHNFPLQDDRGDKTVDRHIDAKFSHQKGKETLVIVTLGEKVKLNPNVQYAVDLSVFTPASKRTHHGEVEGREAPFLVLTNGYTNKLTIIVCPGP